MAPVVSGTSSIPQIDSHLYQDDFFAADYNWQTTTGANPSFSAGTQPYVGTKERNKIRVNWRLWEEVSMTVFLCHPGSSEEWLDEALIPGQLETTYQKVFDRLADIEYRGMRTGWECHTHFKELMKTYGQICQYRDHCSINFNFRNYGLHEAIYQRIQSDIIFLESSKHLKLERLHGPTGAWRCFIFLREGLFHLMDKRLNDKAQVQVSAAFPSNVISPTEQSPAGSLHSRKSSCKSSCKSSSQMPPPRKLAPGRSVSAVDNIAPQPPARTSNSHAPLASLSAFRVPRDPPLGRLARVSIASRSSAGSGSRPSRYSRLEAPGPIPPNHSPAQPPAQLPATVPVPSESSGTSVSTRSDPRYASNAQIVIQNRQFQNELVTIRNQEHTANNRYRAIKGEVLTRTQSLKELETVQDMHLKVRSAAVQEASANVQAQATEHSMRLNTIRQGYHPSMPPAPAARARAPAFASAPVSALTSAPEPAPASAPVPAPAPALAPTPAPALAPTPAPAPVPAPAPGSAVQAPGAMPSTYMPEPQPVPAPTPAHTQAPIPPPAQVTTPPPLAQGYGNYGTTSGYGSHVPTPGYAPHPAYVPHSHPSYAPHPAYQGPNFAPGYNYGLAYGNHGPSPAYGSPHGYTYAPSPAYGVPPGYVYGPGPAYGSPPGYAPPPNPGYFPSSGFPPSHGPPINYGSPAFAYPHPDTQAPPLPSPPRINFSDMVSGYRSQISQDLANLNPIIPAIPGAPRPYGALILETDLGQAGPSNQTGHLHEVTPTRATPGEGRFEDRAMGAATPRTSATRGTGSVEPMALDEDTAQRI
ncbi:hypothetical protein FS749_005036 [Ceratobasidium sp. UAMH 11750]|nr:hypothetical protein FS749_005036 [Ceratobasidium sp. UAMH 11750]